MERDTWKCKDCGETDTEQAYDDTICNDCYIAELEMDED
jgi:NMD protein affecting ribosome stability and mRNA decay